MWFIFKHYYSSPVRCVFYAVEPQHSRFLSGMESQALLVISPATSIRSHSAFFPSRYRNDGDDPSSCDVNSDLFIFVIKISAFNKDECTAIYFHFYFFFPMSPVCLQNICFQNYWHPGSRVWNRASFCHGGRGSRALHDGGIFETHRYTFIYVSISTRMYFY